MWLFDRIKAMTALAMLVTAADTTAGQDFEGREKLRAHSDEFRREVIKVTDGVWVASGFSNANSVLIQGKGGSVGSSRVDLQACKLEYSIVSPK